MIHTFYYWRISLCYHENNSTLRNNYNSFESSVFFARYFIVYIPAVILRKGYKKGLIFIQMRTCVSKLPLNVKQFMTMACKRKGLGMLSW